ncbi:MAG: hypothetical protein IPJ31_12265 [Bacteroidetes bacterium]|nr:hypothetical protein [Bacteroidota bacterium]
MNNSHCLLKTILLLGFAILLKKSAQAQNHLPCLQQSEYRSDWKYVGPFNEYDKTENQHFGAISAISVNPMDPMEIFVGANSAGLFHTSNRGLSWECLTDQHRYPVIGVNDIWIDYTKKPYTILISTGTKTVCDIAQFAMLYLKMVAAPGPITIKKIPHFLFLPPSIKYGKIPHEIYFMPLAIILLFDPAMKVKLGKKFFHCHKYLQ